MDEASTALRVHVISGLKTWLENVTTAHPDLDIYIVDTAGRDALDRKLPGRIAQWLVLNGRPTRGADGSYGAHYWPFGYDWAPGGVTVSHDPGFNRSHLLANPKLEAPDGSSYTLLVAWFGATPVDVLGSYNVALLLFVIALAASAVICWWLARYISMPLTRLQASARRLASGFLDAHVDEHFCARRDEFGILAQDFNQMATRLHSQITSKETLLRDISHELRSPLTRLRVALGLAQRGDDDYEIQFERMEREIERLDSLIGETLQLTRLSGAKSTFARERIELEPLLNETIQDARLIAGTGGVAISLSMIPGLFVDGDFELVRRALDNVLRNAVRFAPAGSNVEVFAQMDGSDIVIAVGDQGPGVPDRDLERIFEAFYRVAEARDRNGGGTGLGLAITARTMALHGGSVKARNAPSGGLIVELRFPQARMFRSGDDNQVKPLKKESWMISPTSAPEFS